MVQKVNAVQGNPFIPYLPTQAQLEFIADDRLEVLYGGAAGGGKSIALLMAALEYVNDPSYNAIIFRRTLMMLEEAKALIPISHEWLKGKANWSEQKKRWTFPSGATLTFRYLDGPRDHQNYQGAAYHFVGFDEATQFRPSDYEYLFSRLRKSEGDDIPVRLRSASNPGGPAHEYFKERFFGLPHPDRAFISARLEDNPHLDVEDYERSLSQLGGTAYAQLRYGDWDAISDGGLIKLEWIDLYDELPDFKHRIIVGDTAQKAGKDNDYSVFQCWGSTGKDAYLIDQIRGKWEYPQLETQGIAFFNKHKAIQNGSLRGLYIEDKASGISLLQSYKQNTGMPIKPIVRKGNKGKTDRAEDVLGYFTSGRVHIPKRAQFTSDLLKEIEAFPAGAHDDQVDVMVDAVDILLNSPVAAPFRMTASHV